QATRPNADTERKLKDAEYELMMAERKLSSAQKALERAEKKVLESAAEQKTLQQQISQTEKSAADQKNLVEKIKANAAAQATQASQKSAEEAARKEAEARANQLAAQQKAAEEAARQAAAAEAQAKQQALVKQLGVDLSDCQPLPTNPPGTELTAIDMQLQAFALGELRRVNRLLEEIPENDSPPLSPAPVLSGSRLKPCDPAQWQALKFSYLGNGQYRLE